MKKNSVILFIILFLGMYLFPYIPLELFNINYYNLSANGKIIYNFICDISFMVVVFTIYYKDIINSFKRYIKDFKNIIKLSFKYYFIGLFLMYITNVIIGLYFNEATPNNEIAGRQMITLYPIYMFFSVAIYAPFVEEIIFRKSIKDMFLDKNNKLIKYIYIIISGFIFGFMHILGHATSSLDYLYIIPYMAVGSSFAYIYYKSDNIFSTIMLHSLHNTVGLIIFLWLGV